MRRTFVALIIGFVLSSITLSGPMGPRTSSVDSVGISFLPVPFEDCFAADPGAGSTNKSEHANWARSQSTGTLIANLQSKIAMVFNCTAVGNEQALQAFGAASGVVARRVSEPVRVADRSCFSGDRGSLNPDDAVHITWARAQSRTTYRDNLIWKVGVAMRCLKAGEPQVELFAEISSILARTPGGDAGRCDGRSYRLPGIAAVKYGTSFTVNWCAPNNHPSNDYLGVYKANTSLADLGNRITWAYLKQPGNAGYENMWAIYGMQPGDYDIYIFNWGSTAPVSNGVRLVVKP